MGAIGRSPPIAASWREAASASRGTPTGSRIRSPSAERRSSHCGPRVRPHSAMAAGRFTMRICCCTPGIWIIRITSMARTLSMTRMREWRGRWVRSSWIWKLREPWPDRERRPEKVAARPRRPRGSQLHREGRALRYPRRARRRRDRSSTCTPAVWCISVSSALQPPINGWNSVMAACCARPWERSSIPRRTSCACWRKSRWMGWRTAGRFILRQSRPISIEPPTS